MTIIYSPKYNQPLISKFFEPLAQLFLPMSARGQVSVLSIAKVRGNPSCALHLSSFLACSQTGKRSGTLGVNGCWTEQAKVKPMTLCPLCQSISTANSRGAM